MALREFTGVLGDGGGWPEWSGDGSLRWRGEVTVEGSLWSTRERVSDGVRKRELK